MRYTLVGAVTLGFDLARLEEGAEVAAVLRAALAVGPDDIAALAAAHPGEAARRATHREIEQVAADREALADVIPLVGEAFEESLRGEVQALRRLERGLLGDPDGLDHLVRHEILDWTWLRSGQSAVQDPFAHDAADVLVDAALAHYLDLRAHPELRRRLLAPFEAAGLEALDDLEIAGSPEVTRLLETLAAADVERLARVRAAVDRDRAAVTARWAPSVHRATWAVSTAERLRSALDSQLGGVVAFRRAGLDAGDAAHGLWNAVAGGLQAQVVADLLSTDDADILLGTWDELSA